MYLDELTNSVKLDDSVSLNYHSNTVYDLKGQIIMTNIHTFNYCDYFLVYTFKREKISSISGPGSLFWRQESGEAIFFLNKVEPDPLSPFCFLIEVIHIIYPLQDPK